MSVLGPKRTFLDFGLRARRGIVTGVSMHGPRVMERQSRGLGLSREITANCN